MLGGDGGRLPAAKGREQGTTPLQQLLCLTKRDLAEVMKDYPVEAKKIQQQAKDRMQQLQLQSEDHDNDDDDGDDNPERSSKRFTQPVGGLRRCMSRGESSKAWQRKD